MKPFNEKTLEFLNKHRDEINSFDDVDQFLNWYNSEHEGSRKFWHDLWYSLDKAESKKLLLAFATMPGWGGA